MGKRDKPLPKEAEKCFAARVGEMVWAGRVMEGAEVLVKVVVRLCGRLLPAL